MGMKGVSGVCVGTNAQVSADDILTGVGVSQIWMFHACLIFCIYPPGSTLTVPAPSSPVIKSPIMTLRTFLGDTILFNYTRDNGPGNMAAQQCFSLYSGYFMVTKILGESRCLTLGDGERCERVLIRSE